MPSAASLWISSQNSRRALGSTPAVGSSSSSRSGLGRMQAPSARRCFQPPDSVPASCFSRPCRPSRSMAARASRRGIGQAVDAGDELQVLLDRQVLVQAEALRHVADVALDLVALRAGCRSRARCRGRCRASAGRTACAAWWSCRSRWGRGSRRSGRACTRMRQVAHDDLAAERLGQAFDLDGEARRWFALTCGHGSLRRLAARATTPAGRRAGRSRPLGHRLDAEHQPRALLLAVDDGRRELGLRRDEVDARDEVVRAAVAAAPRSRSPMCTVGSTACGTKKRTLHVARRQQRHDRPARPAPSRRRGSRPPGWCRRPG